MSSEPNHFQIVELNSTILKSYNPNIFYKDALNNFNIIYKIWYNGKITKEAYNINNVIIYISIYAKEISFDNQSLVFPVAVKRCEFNQIYYDGYAIVSLEDALVIRSKMENLIKIT